MQIELSHIPTTPGIYLFKDKQGRILYVGKAKHLRKRVASYFRGQSRHSPKTTAMLANAESLDTLSTNTEKEALLLEASLIKKHRPRYNVVLKDDKQYLLFCIDKTHPFPKLSIVRPRLDDSKGAKDVTFGIEDAEAIQVGAKSSKHKSVFYGPYTSALAARETWRVIHRIFPLRRCTNRSFKNRVRPCLYYHLGQCLGPCVMPVPEDEYAAVVQRVDMFLNGRSSELIEQLHADMQEASDELNFEQAAKFRDQIKAVELTLEKQSAVMQGTGSLDAVGIAEVKGDDGKNGLGLGILFVRRGRVLGGKTYFWPGLTLAEGPEVITSFLVQFYESATLIPTRILLPWALPSDEDDYSDTMADEYVDETSAAGEMFVLQELLSDKRGSAVYLSVPRSSVEKLLVNMASTNAKESAIKEKRPEIAELLAGRLHIQDPIQRIECVDVSHTSGKDTRVGLVVYENGKPLRDEFRSYIVKDENIAPGDDYGVLAHWAMRRVKSGPPWPDLILVDGGKGQLAAVGKALEEAVLENDIEVSFKLASIAKARTEHGKPDRRAGNVSDLIFLPGRSNPLNLKPGSPELLFLQMVRDSAHDQAIGRHRKARNKAALAGELERLSGVGPKTAKLLWDNFNSLSEMASASEHELAKLPGIGKIKAKSLYQELQKLNVATS